MNLLKYFSSLLIILSLFACSSSSNNKRYNRPPEKKQHQDKQSRFTSENDESTYRSEFDEEPVEDHPVDVREFVRNNKPSNNSSLVLSNREKVMMEIVKYLNTPYQYGGNNKNGIDCSAFTQNVFQKSISFNLPRTASQQYNNGAKISNQHSLQFGDLVFFNTTKDSFPGHVGIFLGDNLFAHASFSRGVTVSSLESSYFKTRYVGARRAVKIP
ncbi:MAG: C40 family peptidase [Melioribacteraceae bacterium]|nr:C40 family peptidase [Melioribacteraceae bacterium]